MLLKKNVFFVLIVLLIFIMQLIPSAVARTSMVITPIEWPLEITDEMLLGKKLFFDKSLSKDSTISCSSCHQFNHGGSTPDIKPIQFNGSLALYNSPSIFNLIQDYKIGWIGQFDSTKEHLSHILNNSRVMGFDWPDAERYLLSNSDYLMLFNKIYEDGLTKDNLINAIVSYENALTTPSPFDNYLKGDDAAISVPAKNGYEMFKRYGCVTCHQGKNVGGNVLQKIGVFIPFRAGQLTKKEDQLGRYLLTKKNVDIQVFRVPSLRNVALTAPYMHDGSIKTLSGMVRIMAKYQLGKNIPDNDIELIIEFLKTLNGAPHPELLP